MKDKNIEYLKNCGPFEHYISLGHCCFVAIELRKLGLRDSSLPFDWVRSRWKAIEYSFYNNFKNFLNYNDLYQKKSALHSYKNINYGVGFFHDFVDYKSLKSQIGDVQKKYNRRIERFFEHIKDTTLFIRYMWDDDELIYISENYDKIEKMIKSYNKNNEIIFISHSDPTTIDTSKIKNLFFIKKSENDELNETPISACKDLYDFLSSINQEKQQNNINFYKYSKIQNEKKSKSFINRIKNKALKLYIKKKKKYIHHQQC